MVVYLGVGYWGHLKESTREEWIRLGNRKTLREMRRAGNRNYSDLVISGRVQ